MEIVKADFGIGFYVASIVISALLFFGWRRLWRRVFRSEAIVVIATSMAAIITTPVVLLMLLWLLQAVKSQ